MDPVEMIPLMLPKDLEQDAARLTRPAAGISAICWLPLLHPPGQPRLPRGLGAAGAMSGNPGSSSGGQVRKSTPEP